MLDDNLKKFVADNRRGVLTTFRRDSSAQMSIITCGPLQDGVAFTTTEDRAKLKNLRRNPRCTLLVARENWSAYIVLQGSAQLLSADNTDADELRLALRDVFRTAAATEHPDWDEYDRAMAEQRRSAIIVVPDHIYGGNVS
ncbi:MAG: PPOX class F420-dependent oxidoreductase [Chloroflexota bacterium]|nr:PPOX class F420-dependent oxidoreductase [Chloroflexota bacterium]